ncbi:MAG: hypothetical protein ABFQ82_06770, partial [Thermodesulfobacteriota bacterium]
MSNEIIVQITGEQQKSIEVLLGKAGFNRGVTSANTMGGDGSDRTFVRLMFGEDSLLAIIPDLNAGHGLNEAKSAWNIGRHLMGCTV